VTIILNNNALEWLEQIPTQLMHSTVIVHVTIRDELPVKKHQTFRASQVDKVDTVKKDNLLGLFADDADLIDKITASAMQARENHPLSRATTPWPLR
jgi:chemotaxis response regulator CheB